MKVTFSIRDVGPSIVDDKTLDALLRIADEIAATNREAVFDKFGVSADCWPAILDADDPEDIEESHRQWQLKSDLKYCDRQSGRATFNGSKSVKVDRCKDVPAALEWERDHLKKIEFEVRGGVYSLDVTLGGEYSHFAGTG